MVEDQEAKQARDQLLLVILFLEIQKRTRQELNALEEELRTSNRFFPRGGVPESLDELIPLCRRKMAAGTRLYRARTIDRQKEEEFTRPFEEALLRALGQYLSDDTSGLLSGFDYRHMNEAITYAVTILGIRGESLDAEALMEAMEPLCEEGWWGYGRDEIDAPPIGAASNGRINPKGIRYLYVSDNPKTCLLEVRPVLTQLVGVGEIELTADITLFDISRQGALESGAYAQTTHMDPNVLAEFFSQPNFGGEAGYLATQYISEYIKNVKDKSGGKVFDGICFNSALDSDGLNIVLFETSDEDRKYTINQTGLFQLEDLSGSYSVILPLNKDGLVGLGARSSAEE